MAELLSQIRFPVREYNLAATLDSGQAFRWRRKNGAWEGVVGAYWVRLSAANGAILAETPKPEEHWQWLAGYLQVEVELAGILDTFPQDEAMQAAVQACRGLRLLRQDPWECLASFILSSTKQIVQIRQIVELVSARFGEPVQVPDNCPPHFSFPGPERLAECSETDLRACKMGFRAPYLKSTATMIARGECRLDRIAGLNVDQARAELCRLPGVGRKIADCVLLFAYGFQNAFPVDVWVTKALRELYFRRRRVKLARLLRFTAGYFGPYRGYAQQYLFHYMRTRDIAV